MKIKAAAIIPAAGSGSRMNTSRPKQFLDLAGKPILVHSVSAFRRHPDIDTIIVVVPGKYLEETRKILHTWQLDDKTVVINGGKRRQDSVKAGLDSLDDSITTVLVHDGARPLVSDELISRCLDQASLHGAAIAAVPVKDTLKKADTGNTITRTIDRTDLWQAQTPQAAGLQQLRNAYLKSGDLDFTDEASLLEYAGYEVRLVSGSETNIKITRPEDLTLAQTLLMQNTSSRHKIGHGFDAHQFSANRDLVLGGIKIEHSHGLAGHSDADVVTHALCDAILGALGKGDIGRHFPDSATEFENIYSIKLLEKVVKLMDDSGYSLGNGDITVICQAPRLAGYIEMMEERLASTCKTGPENINVKATTTEKMGYTGRQEGISCHAVVFLDLKQQ